MKNLLLRLWKEEEGQDLRNMPFYWCWLRWLRSDH